MTGIYVGCALFVLSVLLACQWWLERRRHAQTRTALRFWQHYGRMAPWKDGAA
jgi:hypothetical protein